MTGNDEDKAPRTSAEIEADLAAQRAELTAAVDDLTRSLDPRTQITALKDQAATVALNASDQTKDFTERLKNHESGALRAAAAMGAGVVALGVLSVLARRRSR